MTDGILSINDGGKIVYAKILDWVICKMKY